jgi:hypothetical protein
MRDRLIELIKDAAYNKGCAYWDELADYLLANGVIVPPCKVGQTVYYAGGLRHASVKEAKVEEIYYGEGGFAFYLCADYTYFTLQQEDVFLTKEEAEKALKGGEA